MRFSIIFGWETGAAIFRRKILMRTSLLPTIILLLFAATSPAQVADKPIALHPDNPHYLLFRGKPAVLVTSGEHYGAVLNRDFDFVPYLNELQARKFNLTRTFSGVYHEVPSSFGIVDCGGSWPWSSNPRALFFTRIPANSRGR